MPTVSDLLFVELRFDTAGLESGQQQAERTVAQTRATVQQQGADIERIAKSITANVETALRGVASLFGLVLSFQGFKNLVTQAVEAGTSLGRFSESIGSTAEAVGTLEQAFQRAGLRAESVRAVLQRMNLDIQSVKTGGAIPEWMRLLGQAPFNMGGLQYREPEEIILTASQRAQGMTPALAAQWLSSLGFSPQDITILTKPGELQRMLAAVRREGTAPTTPQVEAAERLTEKFASLEQLSQNVLRDFVVATEPFLTSVLDFTSGLLKWVHRIERWLGGVPTSEAESDHWLQSRYGSLGDLRSGSSPSGMIGARPGFGGFRPHASSGPSPGAVTAAGGGTPSAFIVHHTGGRGDVAGVQETLRQRGLGVQYVMDRDGNITQIGGPGSSHMMPGWGAGAGLSNRNTVGMEVIARDDRDVTPAQIAAAQRFIAERYPNTPVFGHGEVNPGHKEANEGMSIVNAIRRQRSGASVRGSMFNDRTTASGMSAATTAGIALPSGGKMGDWYEVTTPDGRKFVTRLIDRGPAAWTGRGVDISAPLAEQMGYGRDFPTDAKFGVRPLSPSPQSLLRVPDVATGAAAAAAAEHARHVTNHNESTTSVQQVIVNTHATDAAGIAKDVKTEIGKAFGE